MRFRWRVAWRAFMVLLLTGLASTHATGCGRRPKNVPAPVSEADVRDFCRRLQEALEEGSIPAVNFLIDWNGILDRVVQDVDAPEKIRELFRNGSASGFAKPDGLAGQLVERVGQGGDVSFLRSRRVDGQTTALFREVSADGSLQYTEYFLARARDGSTAATDVYFFNSGERVSEQLRRFYLAGVAVASNGSKSGLSGADRAFLDSAPRLLEMKRLHSEGKDEEALAVLDALPPVLQKNRTYLMLRMVFAGGLGGEAQADAIRRFQEAYPDDPSLPLQTISLYIFMKQYDRAMEAVEQVDRAVGGDPYLAYDRAEIHYAAGRFGKARDEARAAIQVVSVIETPYFLLLNALLKLDDHAAVLETLRSLDQRFAQEFEDLTTLPEYAHFVKSPQYTEWKRYVDAKDSATPATPAVP